MSKFRPVLSAILVVGLFPGLTALSGCGDPEEGSAPKLSGKKDDIQKSSQSGVPGTSKGRKP